MGLILDVEAARMEDPAAEEIVRALTRAVTEDGDDGWLVVKDKGCQALTRAHGAREACAQGLFAYRLRRTLEQAENDPDRSEELLRSDSAARFLAWAKTTGVEAAALASGVERTASLENRRSGDETPDKHEASEWLKLIQWFLRNG